MKKSILLVTTIVSLLTIVLRNNSIAVSNGSVYVNYMMLEQKSNQYYTKIISYTKNMGYSCLRISRFYK